MARRYLYGLVPSGAAAPTERGVGGGIVRVEPADHDLGVLASAIEEETIQPRRAHLDAHDRVLRQAMAAGAVLPFRFGTITDGEPRGVLEGVDTGRALELLAELEGRVEVQLVWEPDQDLAVSRVADRHPEVRDRSVAAIDRGRSVAESIAAMAVEDLTAIQAELAPHAVSFGTAEPRGMSARAAALVEHQVLDRFLDACGELAGRTEGAGVLRTVGALPPYSFVALDREPIGA